MRRITLILLLVFLVGCVGTESTDVIHVFDETPQLKILAWNVVLYPLQKTTVKYSGYGVSVGLQSIGEMPERVERLNTFFDAYKSHDEYDREAITHVMACSSHFPGMMI